MAREGKHYFKNHKYNDGKSAILRGDSTRYSGIDHERLPKGNDFF